MIGQVDGTHQSRATPRFKLFQPTEMTASGNTTRVHLLNLSVGGALVHTDRPPAPGTLLRIRCGGALLVARVAWASERKFGVAFAAPLAPAQLEQVLGGRQAFVASAARRIGMLG